MYRLDDGTVFKPKFKHSSVPSKQRIVKFRDGDFNGNTVGSTVLVKFKRKQSFVNASVERPCPNCVKVCLHAIVLIWDFLVSCLFKLVYTNTADDDYGSQYYCHCRIKRHTFHLLIHC